MTNVTVTAELANNSTYVLREGWCVSALAINARDGMVRVKWEGISCDEIMAMTDEKPADIPSSSRDKANGASDQPSLSSRFARRLSLTATKSKSSNSASQRRQISRLAARRLYDFNPWSKTAPKMTYRRRKPCLQ